jgi:hypothetical protein
MYTGQAAAGRGGFAYNTNTGSGVAAGGNNIYAGKNGDVYRYNRQSGDWSQNTGSGWKSASNPSSICNSNSIRAPLGNSAPEFQWRYGWNARRRRPQK